MTLRGLGSVVSPIVYLSGNWLSRIGVALVTSAAVFWLFFLPMAIRGAAAHPYIGIVQFLLIPSVFFAGLALIPLGVWRQRRRRRERGEGTAFPRLSLDSPEVRRLARFVGVMTVLNIILGAVFTYQGVSYMDSVTFCGRTCHTVMQPEYAAYQNSPHSRVDCVACHIGAGASWFVKSKLSGVGQVFAVAFNTYPRPIPTPVRNLRPARETCETCHWPQKFGDDRLRIVYNYADDEANTLTKTVLLMRIGPGHGSPGIHGAHLGQGVVIAYRHSDESRQTIPRVEYRNNVTGRAAVYTAADAKPGSLDNLPVREMDCMDCHNRPTHIFSLPEREVNAALASGAIQASLPFAKRQGIALLRARYESHEAAARAIPEAFERFYREQHPAVYAANRAGVVRAGRRLAAIYERNVFPAMNVAWGTYPYNIGHTDFPGCYRCHDENHIGPGGQKIGQDCNSCHQLLAMEEASPKILSDLGFE